jgi:RING-variant domain/FHA domain
MNAGQPKIIINSKTWLRDSHKLFDYECLGVSKQQYVSERDCSILRVGNELDFLESSQEVCFSQPESKIIAKIERLNSGYTVKSFSDEELWLVVKTLNPGHRLEFNDTIKLGRVKLRVNRLRTKNMKSEKFSQLIVENTGTCRICLQDDSQHENPLIIPCKCSGSMKHIHLFCLQTWINSKLMFHCSGSSTSYYWKNMDCEICKQQYPLAVNWNGPNALLSKVEESGDPYIILEALERDKNNARGVYLMQFRSEEVFKLGRGHESHIKIHDISVSRCHAYISYTSDKFFLKDNQSKFGTLVQIPQSYNIKKSLTIQVGRTLLSLKTYSPDALTEID